MWVYPLQPHHHRLFSTSPTPATVFAVLTVVHIKTRNFCRQTGQTSKSQQLGVWSAKPYDQSSPVGPGLSLSVPHWNCCRNCKKQVSAWKCMAANNNLFFCFWFYFLGLGRENPFFLSRFLRLIYLSLFLKPATLKREINKDLALDANKTQKLIQIEWLNS